MSYYRRDGTKYDDVLDWAKDYEQHKNKRVANDVLEDGTRISTVWLGIDHNFGMDGPPMIFETMVFPKENYNELDMERYGTEDQAKHGHEQMVLKWEEELNIKRKKDE